MAKTKEQHFSFVKLVQQFSSSLALDTGNNKDLSVEHHRFADNGKGLKRDFILLLFFYLEVMNLSNSAEEVIKHK